MTGKNGKVREIWGRQFTIVKNGLDEGEVFSFVGSLIEQNNDYAEKLEHLDALTRLGESTVVEAEREAERIRLQAHEIASEETRAVVAELEEKAKVEAQRIIAESEQLAQEMLKSAEETARAQAERIIAEAEANIQSRLSAVEQLAQDIIRGVETDAKRKAKAVKAKANKEAQVSKRAAQQLVDRSKKLAQSEIRDKFEGVYQELLSVLDTEGIDKLNVSELES
jgi:vacuolar-type H+-ATPase subunit H